MYPFPCRKQPDDSARRRALHVLTLFCFSLLLAGCSTPQWKESFEQPDWQVSGKIGVREDIFKATSGLFQWSQKGDDYIIHVYSGLGQLQFTLYGNQKFARIERADGLVETAHSAQALLTSLTGWSFPVESTYHWLTGSTTADETNLVLNEEQRPKSFDSEDWHISLSNYQDVDGQTLPSRIRLKNPELTVTIIIKEYVHVPRI